MADTTNISNIKKKILSELKLTRDRVENYNNTKKKVGLFNLEYSFTTGAISRT
jgi:hypothetical protein